MNKILLSLITITSVAIATVTSITGCTSIEDDFLKVSQGFELLNEEIQGDTLKWQEKFALLLADTSMSGYAGAYANTKSYTAFLVTHLDGLIAIFEKLDPGDHQTPTDMMVKQRKGEDLANKIELYRNEVLAIPIWNEEDVAYLKDSMPSNTYYDMDNARRLMKKDWAAYHFEDVSVIAAVAVLKKFKNDALRSQSMVWGRIYEKATIEVEE